MEETDFRKYVVIFLALIALALIVFAIAIIYMVISLRSTQEKVNRVLDNTGNITNEINQGITNVRKDVANIKTKGSNAVQNFIADAKAVLPSLFGKK